MIERILCPVDFSDCSRTALRYAVAIGRWQQARVSVLNVGPAVLVYEALVSHVTPTAVATPTRSERASQVARLLQPFVDHHNPIDVILEEGDAAAAIASTVERQAIDLIVMGTHGRTGLGQLMFGSVTRQIIGVVRSPVLIVPAGPGPLPSFHGFTRVLCTLPPEELAWGRLLAAAEGAEVTFQRVPGGADELVQLTRETKPDLIVLRRGPAIESVLRTLAVPVLIGGQPMRRSRQATPPRDHADRTPLRFN